MTTTNLHGAILTASIGSEDLEYNEMKTATFWINQSSIETQSLSVLIDHFQSILPKDIKILGLIKVQMNVSMNPTLFSSEFNDYFLSRNSIL